MKNRIVKKVLRIIFLVFVGVAVVGTAERSWTDGERRGDHCSYQGYS